MVRQECAHAASAVNGVGVQRMHGQPAPLPPHACSDIPTKEYLVSLNEQQNVG